MGSIACSREKPPGLQTHFPLPYPDSIHIYIHIQINIYNNIFSRNDADLALIISMSSKYMTNLFWPFIHHHLLKSRGNIAQLLFVFHLPHPYLSVACSNEQPDLRSVLLQPQIEGGCAWESTHWLKTLRKHCNYRATFQKLL